MKREKETVLELSPLTEDDSGKRQYYRSIFDKYDKNHSGVIDLKELRELIGYDDDIPKRVTKKIFNAADKNRDGQIDFDEFLSMVDSQDYKEIFQKYVNIYIRNLLPRRHPDCDDVDGPYEESYTCCPLPFAMVLISAFEVACFVTDEITRKDSTLDGTGVTAKIFIYDPYRREEAWRFFTYMFVHIGKMHLSMNLTVQLLLGVPLEMVHRWWRVLIVYFAGVVAGSLGTSVTDPGVYLAGASGGVYAMLTAHIAAIIMNWSDMSCPLFQLTVLLLLTVLDVGNAVYSRYWLDANQNVGYAAHVAGAVAGLLVGVWALKNFSPSRREACLWWGAAVGYASGTAALVAANFVWTDHFLRT